MAAVSALQLLAEMPADEFLELIARPQIAEGPGQAPLTVSGAELAKRLGVSRTSVHRMREQGCPAIRICDSWRFEIEAVMTWLRERK